MYIVQWFTIIGRESYCRSFETLKGAKRFKNVLASGGYVGRITKEGL